MFCLELVDVARDFSQFGFERRVAMRFKKGNKVEVWSRREHASGSWWSAEIISGNGHNYSVRYDAYPTDSSVAVDRVPTKAIRPCPPPVEGLKDVKSGDVVEVFDNNSWKLAEVLMVVDEKYCSVRLIGSSREFRTHNSHIRRHLSWQDEQWMAIPKDSGKQHGGILNSSSRGEKFGYRKPQSCVEMVNSAGKSRFPIGSHDFPENTRWVLPRRMKKRPLDLSIPAEMCNDGRRKTRAVEKDGKCHGIITKHPIQCFKKGQNWRLPNFDSIGL
ncbi:agenet domain containing protein [Musa troglodytarum]|uniref:Agenet domain containing protein n=1 Tax=Musa troglodytarum TaxID=320322 RepID=A0A9E7I273_9LILI|nr:agenet domain containing protein [Musa troglodytarum]